MNKRTGVTGGHARGHCYFNRSRVSKVRATRIEQENRSHVRVRKRVRNTIIILKMTNGRQSGNKPVLGVWSQLIASLRGAQRRGNLLIKYITTAPQSGPPILPRLLFNAYSLAFLNNHFRVFRVFRGSLSTSLQFIIQPRKAQHNKFWSIEKPSR